MSDDPNPQPDPAPAPPPDPPHGGPPPNPAPTPDPPAESAEIKAEARKWEKRAKDNHTALERAQAQIKAEQERVAAILKAAGIGADEDPAEAAKRNATERDEAIARAEAIEKRMRERDLLDYARDAGEKQGANVAALMNTHSLRTAIAELDDKAGEKEVAAIVKAELEANPHLSAAAGPPARTVRDASGTGEPQHEPAPGLDRLRAAFGASAKSRTR